MYVRMYVCMCKYANRATVVKFLFLLMPNNAPNTVDDRKVADFA